MPPVQSSQYARAETLGGAPELTFACSPALVSTRPFGDVTTARPRVTTTVTSPPSARMETPASAAETVTSPMW